MQTGWWVLTLMVLWIALWAPPAQGAACTLYPGDNSPKQLALDQQRYQRQSLESPGEAQPFCLLAHIHFKLAGLATNDPDRVQAYKRCIDMAEAALSRNAKAAAAYFLKGLCLGKRAEVEGIWASLEMIEPFEELMSRAAELEPGLDHGGPHRALGRYYHELPWLLGGSLDKAITHLEQAVRLGPEHWQNLLFLAEAYMADDQTAAARDTLIRLVEVTRPRAGEAGMATPLKRARALLNQIQTRTGSP